MLTREPAERPAPTAEDTVRRFHTRVSFRFGRIGFSVRWPIAFAGLFFFATFSRAVLVSVLPLQAHELLGSAQAVSVLYFFAAALGIATSISVPVLLQRLGASRTFYTGVLAMLVSTALLGSGASPLFIAGIAIHFMSIAVMDVPLNAYILNETPRRQISRFEPLRILYTVFAFAIGPWLGVFLESRVDEVLPYTLAGGAALLSILYFRWLGLHKVEFRHDSARPVSPLDHVRRFAGQPRMRLAWTLALARAAWWMTFVIYTPIYAKVSGLGELAGAATVSIGTAWVLTVTWWGRIGRRFGLRRLLTAGFLATSALSVLVGLCAGWPWVALTLLVWNALAATALDGAGNVPFLRSVHPFERSEMTGVYLTYRDIAQLGAPGLFALLLGVFQLHVVFFAAGGWMFCVAYLCRYIPRRM